MDTNWPLVGRAEELALLTSALSRPGWHGAVLAGSAGVGKTRLATELAQRAQEDGWRVVRVSATESMSAIAFGAMIQLLPPDAVARDGAVELMMGLRAELRRLGADRRVLLCVDDAHLLDGASAAATHMLAATRTAFVVVTVRSREPVSDAIAALWKDGHAGRVELQPLSRLETAAVLGAGLGGHVDSLTQYRLWNATRGNVLFLRELVRAGVDGGRLRRRGAVWSWVGDISFGERLTGLIEARLAGLVPTEREVLEVLAVGEPLGPDYLPGAELLESLEERGLISVIVDGRRTLLRLAHPLYAELLRVRMGVLRRRSIHSGLADRLAEVGANRRGDLVRLAGWRLAAGDPVDAVTLVAAARQARRVFDHRAVERFARAASAGDGGADAHVLLADALYWQGRHVEATEVLERVPAEGERSAESLVWQAIVTASNLFWGLGDTVSAEQVLGATQELLGPGAEHDELAAHRAYIVQFNGRPHEAIAIAEAVLTAPHATDLTRFRALNALVLALAVAGRTSRAIEAAEAGILVVHRIADDEPWSTSYLQAGQASAYWFAGRLDDMYQLAQDAYAAATSRLADDVRGLWATLLGRALLAKGRVASARQQLLEAAELLRQHDIGGLLSWCLACCSLACTQLGDAREAAALLAEANRVHRPMVRTGEVEIVLAEAWLAAGEGDHGRARRLARTAAAEAVARGQRAVEALAVHDALRLGEPGTHTRLARIATAVDGELAPACAAHAAALATGDGPALLLAAQRFEVLGATLFGAEAAAGAAAAYHRRGDMPAHLAALDYSRSLTAQCEGATTPILRAVAEAPALAALTTREREIAELAARGLSNREISDRLVLSIRTVGNHLNHIYGKLGVSREDLGPLCGPAPRT